MRHELFPDTAIAPRYTGAALLEVQLVQPSYQNCAPPATGSSQTKYAWLV
jgi:hypothetical protein